MCNTSPPVSVECGMGLLFRSAVAFGLAAGLGLPAAAQGERCTRDTLGIEGANVAASFCVPAGAAAPNVSVTETFTLLGKTLQRTTPLAVVAGALTSRTIDDVDLAPIGLKRSLHMTLAYRLGLVSLEHALALPGATPVK
jgi:hypothetical protein